MKHRIKFKNPRHLLCLFIALFGSGCISTEYHEQNFWDPQGYKDREIEPGVYEIEAIGNGFTKPEVVLGFWHRRASELCGEDNYLVEVESGVKDASTMAMVGSTPVFIPASFPMFVGIARCKGNEAK